MARVVTPWTWMRAVREHAPRNRDFRCAMLTLHTFMDANGFAFPSLRTWAEASCMSVNTLRKHLQTAVERRWIVVDQRHGREKGWAQNRYRCVVPSEIELNEKDEMLADALVAKVGDIEIGEDSRTIASDTDQSSAGVSLHADTRSDSNRDAVSAMNDTPTDASTDGVSPKVDTPRESNACNASALRDGVSNGGASCIKTPPLVCQSDPLGVSKNGLGVSTHVDTEVSKFLEVSEVLKTEGAVASNSTFRSQSAKRSGTSTTRARITTALQDLPKEVRIAKAADLLAATPDIGMEKLATIYELTDLDLQQLGSQAA